MTRDEDQASWDELAAAITAARLEAAACLLRTQGVFAAFFPFYAAANRERGKTLMVAARRGETVLNALAAALERMA